MESKAVKNRTLDVGTAEPGNRTYRTGGGGGANGGGHSGPSSYPHVQKDWPTAIPLLNSTRFCEEWEGAQHLLFQSANLCFVVAFLVPRRSRLSGLVLRTTLAVGFLLTTIWAGAEVCALDILAWNLTFLVTNCAHAVYLACKSIPPMIDPELQDLFVKVFVPLRVSKKRFKELVRESELQSLDEDDHYAVEGVTPADERLAMLISGRMRATCENVLLHHIRPQEFIDSPEFEACAVGSDKLFQVTITAEEPCRVLCWSRRGLEATLRTNRCLDVLLRNLTGKDITHKLYSLNEVHRLQEMQHCRRDSASDWWRGQIPRSLSADAVHTGARGRVRSTLWRTQDGRRSSGSPRSPNGSPGFAFSRPAHPAGTPSCFTAHFSDPGPSTIPGPGTALRLQPVRRKIPTNTGATVSGNQKTARSSGSARHPRSRSRMGTGSNAAVSGTSGSSRTSLQVNGGTVSGTEKKRRGTGKSGSGPQANGQPHKENGSETGLLISRTASDCPGTRSIAVGTGNLSTEGSLDSSSIYEEPSAKDFLPTRAHHASHLTFETSV